MGLSFGHLLILGVVFLLFGTKRLPDLASALGKSVRAFREALSGTSRESLTQEQARHKDSEGK